MAQRADVRSEDRQRAHDFGLTLFRLLWRLDFLAMALNTDRTGEPAGRRLFSRRAPTAQLEEAADLKFVKCRFESDLGTALVPTGHAFLLMARPGARSRR